MLDRHGENALISITQIQELKGKNEAQELTQSWQEIPKITKMFEVFVENFRSWSKDYQK